MSDLLLQIKADMKDAMRNKEKVRLTAIRMLLAAIKQIEVDQRIVVDETGILVILDKMVKQRKDSISQFEAAAETERASGNEELAASRQHLADNEKEEIEALQGYMPKALSESEVAELVDVALKESGAETMRDMGKVMAILKPQLQGRADMGAVSGIIKAKLG